MLRAVAGDGSALPAQAFCWVKSCKLPVGCFAGRAGSVYILSNCSSQLWAVALQAQASLVCHWCCWCFIFMVSLTWIGQLNLTSSWWSNYQNNKPIYLLFYFFFSTALTVFDVCALAVHTGWSMQCLSLVLVFWYVWERWNGFKSFLLAPVVFCRPGGTVECDELKEDRFSTM